MSARSILVASLLCLPIAATAEGSTPERAAMPAGHPAIGEGATRKEGPSPWSQFADYTLTLKVPPEGKTGTLKFRTFANPSDVIVDLDTPGPKGRTRGSIMLVGGLVIAAKGIDLDPRFAVSPLDEAILSLKVLTQLLDAALPEGPGALKGDRSVSAGDDKTPIVASTPSASGRFDAPWTLKGNVKRVDADTIAFRLALDVPAGQNGKDRARWTFSGNASGTQKGRTLDDAMDLSGWTAYALGPKANDKLRPHASLRFAATPLSGPFATLKSLRAAMQ